MESEGWGGVELVENPSPPLFLRSLEGSEQKGDCSGEMSKGRGGSLLLHSLMDAESVDRFNVLKALIIIIIIKSLLKDIQHNDVYITLGFEI